MIPLRDRSSITEVENVVVFVADSLRYDALPDMVRERGVTARMIAPSTATASSMPSLMSGTYPATHRVWDFDDTLPETPALLQGPDRGLTTQNVWQDLSPERRPPLRSLRLTEETTLDDVTPPFTVIIHDRGAHGPYNYLNNDIDRSDDFFETFDDQPEKLESMYYRGAQDVGERFVDLVNSLDVDETLVVFTSDHGELLGESEYGGIWGHGTPMCRELAEVPTVFLGAGLPEGEGIDRLISGTDIAPTLLSAQDRDVPDHIEGVDIWTTSPDSDRVIRSDFRAPGDAVSYQASYARSQSGGLVHHYGRRTERLLFAIHRQLYAGAQAPANRSIKPRAALGLLRAYGKQERTHGNPDVEMLRESIPEEFKQARPSETEAAAPSEDQLKALGYLE